MKNKVNYIEAMSFINLISYTARQWKLKKSGRIQKNGIAIFYDIF